MQRKNYIASDHELNHNLIDRDALEVIHRLKQAGYEAFLVGGGIRDLLTGHKPKDFDISTSARPEEIKEIFNRQCILIGKRFRLAHIRFGNKILEVATFRSGENTDLLITRDNTWGSPEEDAMRRDFTINGLFYDPETNQVIDYVGGWEDIHNRVLKSIGDPIVRFKQDPVRMIRLLKFKARFNFHIHESCQKALDSCKEEIVKSAPARILEEILRMLESGYSEYFFKLLYESSLLELLFPCISYFIEGPHGHEIYSFLQNADIVNLERSYRPLDRNVLCACLLFPILEQELKIQFINKGITPHISDILLLSGGLIKAFVTSSFSHFPKKMSSTIGYILATQFRFTPFSGKVHHKPKLYHHKEFPLALQLFKLRAMIHPEFLEDYETWKKLLKQHQSHEKSNPGPSIKKYKRRKYYPRKTINE